MAEVEKGLILGHINSNTPEVALEYHTRLGGYLSTCYGMIERIDTAEAEYFVNNRASNKSDVATSKAWKVSKEGIRQNFWETRIKRLKILSDTLSVVYYHAKMEMQTRNLK